MVDEFPLPPVSEYMWPLRYRIAEWLGAFNPNVCCGVTLCDPAELISFGEAQAAEDIGAGD